MNTVAEVGGRPDGHVAAKAPKNRAAQQWYRMQACKAKATLATAARSIPLPWTMWLPGQAVRHDSTECVECGVKVPSESDGTEFSGQKQLAVRPSVRLAGSAGGFLAPPEANSAHWPLAASSQASRWSAFWTGS